MFIHNLITPPSNLKVIQTATGNEDDKQGLVC
jgi:hypothetical protein